MGEKNVRNKILSATEKYVNGMDKISPKKYQDRVLICKNCGKEFIFTAKQQQYYAEHLYSDPVRCDECREKH